MWELKEVSWMCVNASAFLETDFFFFLMCHQMLIKMTTPVFGFSKLDFLVKFEFSWIFRYVETDWNSVSFRTFQYFCKQNNKILGKFIVLFVSSKCFNLILHYNQKFNQLFLKEWNCIRREDHSNLKLNLEILFYYFFNVAYIFKNFEDILKKYDIS